MTTRPDAGRERQAELPTPDGLGRVRPHRVGGRYLTDDELDEMAETAAILAEEPRPRTVAECPTGPCPWVGCRYHLALEVVFDGSLAVYRPGPWPRRDLLESIAEDVASGRYETCALRLAARGGRRNGLVAESMAIDETGVNELERRGLESLRQGLEAAGFEPSDVAPASSSWGFSVPDAG